MNRANEKAKQEMPKRVLSAAVLLIVTVGALIWCRESRMAFLTLVSVLCCREMCNALRKYSLDVKEAKDRGEPATPLFRTKWPLVAICVAGMGALFYGDFPTVWTFAWYFCSIFALLFAEIVSKDWYIPERGRNAMSNLFCLVYPAVPCFLLMYVGSVEPWAYVYMIGCLATFTCDAFALFGGMAYGKHKMASVLSPKKTWEGAVTGALASVGAGALAYVLLNALDTYLPGTSQLRLFPCMITGLVASTFGQVGDLIASLFKRMAGVKDYSNLIPGHGGMLDRVDSLLFSIPATLFCMSLFHMI